ncbi:uncharacterized protein LOC141728582 [Zonotrichia albicollis]|uniref:uncharacterized protein LOC141728582 n=1 Tax=Zonotrichia albicollis TaxID=44394 RepID=UPI003D8118B5
MLRRSAHSSLLLPRRPSGARSIANRSGAGSCRPRTPTRSGDPSSLSFSLLLAPIPPSLPFPALVRLRHGLAGRPERRPLPGGVGGRCPPAAARPASPATRQSEWRLLRAAPRHWPPPLSVRGRPRGGARRAGGAGSERGRAAAALRLRHLSESRWEGGSARAALARAERSGAERRRGSSGSADSPCELIPAQAAAVPPHGAAASASGRGSAQRVRPGRGSGARSGAPRCGRAGAAGGGAERGGCECGGAAPAPRCAELSRASRAASGHIFKPFVRKCGECKLALFGGEIVPSQSGEDEAVK